MHIVLVFALYPLLFLSTVAVYRLCFHSLSRVPGPRLAAVSSLWYAHQVRNGRLLELAKTLHKKYGPAVRVRPNEVWFNSPEAFKTIYNPSHGFEKSDFYLTTCLFRPKTDWKHPFHLTFPDTLDLLSERDLKRYRLQRRLIGPVYHESNVGKFAGSVDTVLRRAVSALEELDSDEVVDLKEWMHIITVECLGAVVLSWSPGYLKDRSDHGSSAVGYYNWRRKSVFGLFPALVVADLHSQWVGKVFASVWRLGYERRPDFKNLFQSVGQKVSIRLRKALRPRPNAGVHAFNDLLFDLVTLHKTRPEFSELYLKRQAVTNFGAGHETMCSALTAIMTMIGSHQDVYRRVAEEIRRASLKKTPVNSAREAAEHLPFACASIKEAQRLHPAIGMSLSRTVPAGGAVIDGHYLPPGTVVGCCPAALHRCEDIFGPDADTFRPERWLECGREKRIEMERVNLTWGGGSRSCPGRYLAEMIVYKTVISLVQSFDIEAIMPPADQIQYYFLAMLTGARARFKEAGE